MRSVSVVLILAVVTMASETPTSDKKYYDVGKANDLFDTFVKEHNRNYKDDADKDAHFHAFVESLKKINKLNAESTSATYGINNFADYTEDERKNMFGLKKSEN